MNIKKIICISLLMLLIFSCELPGFEREESSAGFIINIINRTNKEYSGFVLYLGDKQDGVFIEKDSLIAENVKIYKKNEGPDSSIDSRGESSYIRSNRDFRGLKGLSEFGKWVGNFGTLERLYFKMKLSDGTIISSENPKLRINSSSDITLSLNDDGNRLIY